MRPVELVEDDEDVTSSDPPRPPDDETPRADRRPVPRRAWVAGAVVLALVLTAGAVATAVTERRAQQRADAIARLPGLVRPLDGPPRVLWEHAGDGPTPVLVAGDGVLTVTGDEQGWVVRGHDVADGAVRWEHTLVEGRGVGYEQTALLCAPGDEPDALVLCAWTEPTAVYGGTGGAAAAAPPTHVVALDPVAGTRDEGWQVDGEALSVVRLEDDAVVATELPDRRVLVERRAGRTGEVVWSWTSAPQVVEDGAVLPTAGLLAAGPVVALVGVATTLLDAATGEVREAGPVGRRTLVRALPDGGYASWASPAGGRLHDADGTPRGPVVALPVTVVTDGGWRDLLVDSGNRVSAVDPADGTSRWRLATSAAPVAVVDGVVVLAADAALAAADARDGTLLWEQDLDEQVRGRTLTDGLHVLTAEGSRQGAELVARGLRDGVVAWRVPLPDGTRQLYAAHGRVVAITRSEVVVLG